MKPDSLPQPAWNSFNDLIGAKSPEGVFETSLAASPGLFFHRDLNWLRFNERVLAEAASDDVPLLERLRFLGIVSSNLDEFFMVRVGILLSEARRQKFVRGLRSPQSTQILSQIRERVLFQKSRQASIFRELLPLLAKEGIEILTDFQSSRQNDAEILERLPKIKYLMRQKSTPLPPLQSDCIHVFVRFEDAYAILTIENRGDRLLSLPPSGKTLRFALVERWLTARAADFFKGQPIVEAFPFKIIRDADLRYHPDDEDSLEQQILEALQRRTKARIVRLEVDASHYSEGAMSLASALGLGSGTLYRFDVPLDLRTLSVLSNLDSHHALRYPPIKPLIPPGFQKQEKIFETIRKRDYLLHHPYDSFDVIIWFLKEAARDPAVTKIYHTLYRTSHESPIIDALKDAAKNGKQVTVYVEIKARFDELNNVRCAESLRLAGVKVVRPMGGFKVHSKITLVVRTGDKGEEFVSHLGTGNYHPGTAKQYTDLGLLTVDPVIGKDVAHYFSVLARQEKHPVFSELLVAPFNLHDHFEKLIRQETQLHLKNGGGHIIAKMNSLVDARIIRALYDASQAGVKIDLLVRGISCLRPGVKNLSENIRVVSVIDRFLEHSRIYYFRSGGADLLFLSSADWMPRNFYMRYETAFPVKDPVLKDFIRNVILETSLNDNAKAWALKADGTYIRVPKPALEEKETRSQFVFESLANQHYKGTLLESRLKSLADLQKKPK